MDVDSLVFVVLEEATSDQDSDLQISMQQVQAETLAKQSLRDLQNEVNAEIAAAGKSAGSAKCISAFCRALPSKLTDLANKTATTPKPVRLQSPTNLTYGQLQGIQSQLSNSLDSMNEMSEMTSMRLQMAMDRRSKFIETLSNLMKSVNDTSTAIISNMK